MLERPDRKWLLEPRKKLKVGVRSCDIQEAKMAELVPEGKLVPGSGSSSRHNRRGDVVGHDFCLEAKTTSKDSLAVQRQWLEKIRVDAHAVNKLPALAIGFDKTCEKPREDWVAVDAEDFGRIMRLLALVREGKFSEALSMLMIIDWGR